MNFGFPDSNISNATAGIITVADDARTCSSGSGWLVEEERSIEESIVTEQAAVPALVISTGGGRWNRIACGVWYAPVQHLAMRDERRSRA